MHDEYCIVLCVPKNLRWSLYEYLPSQKQPLLNKYTSPSKRTMFATQNPFDVRF